MRDRGFTLLEVMVAIAILGLGLTSILSAQTNAVSGVAKARTMSLAVGLARCKMTEIEAELAQDGFQELDQADSGPCCDENESVVRCEWRVEKPVFPDPELGKLDLDTDLDSLGALGSLVGGPKGKEGAPAPAPGDIGSIASALGGEGDIGQLAAGGIGGIAATVMSMVYPDLKTLFEASTRRVTVIASWQEGSKTYDIEIMQWVTQPQPGPVIPGDPATDGTLPGTPGSTRPGGGRPGGPRSPITGGGRR